MALIAPGGDQHASAGGAREGGHDLRCFGAVVQSLVGEDTTRATDAREVDVGVQISEPVALTVVGERDEEALPVASEHRSVVVGELTVVVDSQAL